MIIKSNLTTFETIIVYNCYQKFKHNIIIFFIFGSCINKNDSF